MSDDNEFRLIVFEDLARMPEPLDFRELSLAFRTMYKCPNCGRLWIFWHRGGEPPTVYRLDEFQPETWEHH